MDYSINYRQKDKGWQYIISKKENGKWTQIKSKQGFKLKGDAKPIAEATLQVIKKDALNKKYILNEDYIFITFKQLSDSFIEHSKLYREYNTIRNYKNYAKAFEGLNIKKVKDIKKGDIQKVVDSLVNLKKSPGTIRAYIKRGNLFFKYYIENYDPSFINPINKITLPKIIDTPEKKALTKKEMSTLMSTLKNDKHKLYIAALIAGTCGLRAGEIFGLTWDDVDEINSTLNIHRQWKRLAVGLNGFGELKSKKSKRLVPIPPKTLLELKKHHKTSITDIHNRIVPYNDSQISYLNSKLKKLSGISIHELRHTYATLLISNGIDFKTAAELLGHDVEQTLKTYSHVTSEMIDNAKIKIAKIF